MGSTLFFAYAPIAWANVRRSALKVTKSIDKLGSGILKMWTIAPDDGSRDTAHAQSQQI